MQTSAADGSYAFRFALERVDIGVETGLVQFLIGMGGWKKKERFIELSVEEHVLRLYVDCVEKNLNCGLALFSCPTDSRCFIGAPNLDHLTPAITAGDLQCFDQFCYFSSLNSRSPIS
jgi:hypothetical protein